MRKIACIYNLLTILLLAATSGYAQQEVITTIAGNGVMGYSGDGGTATAAELRYPYGQVLDKAGNIYICDYSNYYIRKVSNNGIITRFAGNGTPGITHTAVIATNASIVPAAIAIDNNGNLYVADNRNHCVYKIDTTQTIQLLAGNGAYGFSGDGGPSTNAMLNSPNALATDNAGNLYIADNGNERIRMIDTFGNISTIAGNGFTGFSGDGSLAVSARLNNPCGVTVDRSGNLYIADASNSRIRMVNTAGVINTCAGSDSSGFRGDNAAATAARLDMPMSVVTDTMGNLFIADMNNSRIRMVNPSGIITTFAGKGVPGYTGDHGPADSAAFNDVYGLAIDTKGFLYTADENNARIRKMFPNYVPTFTGGGVQAFQMCENGVAVSIDYMMQITDADTSQPETWSVLVSPSNGILNASYTATSNGGDILPTGLTFVPNTGFTGNDTFSVVVYDGYSKDTTIVYVTVTPTPAYAAISGTDTICAGTTDTMQASIAGGIWSVYSAMADSISSTGILAGLNAGTDSVIYWDSNICGTSTLEYTVYVQPIPVIAAISGHDSICVDGTDTLMDARDGGIWSLSSLSVATISPTGVVKGMVSGMDTAIYSLEDHVCGIVSTTYPLHVLPLTRYCTSTINEINSGNESALTIYPNPAQHEVNINWNTTVEEVGVIIITDLTGREVYTSNIAANKEKTLNINVTNGIYVITISGKSGNFIRKLTVDN